MKSSKTTGSAATLDEFGFDADGDPWLDHLQEALVPPEIGAIGPYEIVAEVARGGQGVVYRARQAGTNREIALKRLVEGRLATATARRRFEREIEAAAALQHPSIVPVYGMDVVDGAPMLALQWIEGEHVDTWSRKRKGPARRDEVLRLFLRLCDPVEHAHRHGILHLDLKPSNVIAEAGRAKLIDLSLARPPGDAHAGIGTWQYLSPEQARGGNLTAAADVWGIGAVLFEAATGEAPFDDDSDAWERAPSASTGTYSEAEPERYPQLERRARRPEEVADVGGRLGELIAACLEPEPGDRPDLVALLAGLEEVAETPAAERRWSERAAG